MPLHPESQTKLDDAASGIIEILEKGGPAASTRTKPAIQQVERHILGLVGAMKQLDAGMESKVRDYLVMRFAPAPVVVKTPTKKPKGKLR
jgi:hypothetical protein